MMDFKDLYANNAGEFWTAALCFAGLMGVLSALIFRLIRNELKRRFKA